MNLFQMFLEIKIPRILLITALNCARINQLRLAWKFSG